MSSLSKALDNLERKAHEEKTPHGENNSMSISPPASAKTPDTLPLMTGSEPRCLRLVASESQAWELPWLSFYGAEYTADATAHDCIILSFLRYEATLRGRNLGALLREIHAMALSEVRTIDKKYLDHVAHAERPAVVSLEVMKVGRS